MKPSIIKRTSPSFNSFKGYTILVSLLIVFTPLSYAQNGVEVQEKMKIEFMDGHGCMTQTRTETKEEALYNISQCGPVRYELSKKGKFFRVFEMNDGKWTVWGEYHVQHSYQDALNDSERYVFLMDDGSQVVYVPETGEGPLVILDLAGQELIHFTYN